MRYFLRFKINALRVTCKLIKPEKTILKTDVLKGSNSDHSICAGSGCHNTGKIALEIKYLKKIGFFCKSCKEDLVKGGLADEVLGTDKVAFMQTSSDSDLNLKRGRTR